MDEKQVKELQKYVQDANCKQSDTSVSKDSTSRIAELAKPRQLPPKLYLDEMQEAMYSKEKQERIEKFLKDGHATTEELELFVKAEAQRDMSSKRLQKSKERIYQNVLSKLESQCRDQIMSNAVDKFASFMSEKCVDSEPCAMMTESGQSLSRGIIFNMYLSLGIGKKKLKDVDQSLCERFATVLSNLITEALYAAEVGIARPSYIEAKSRTSMDTISEQYLKNQAISAAKRIVHRQAVQKRKAEEQLRAALIDNLG